MSRVTQKPIDISNLVFKLTGKFKAPREGEVGIGKSWVPPLTLNLKNQAPIEPVNTRKLRAANLPDSFCWTDNDSVEKYKGDEYTNLLSNVGSQGQCGMCFAYAATTSLGDRFAIATRSKNPQLGPTYLLSCSITGDCNKTELMGCNGGIISTALNNMGTVIGGVKNKCSDLSWLPPDNEAVEDMNALIPKFTPLGSQCPTDPPIDISYYKVIPDSVKVLETPEQVKDDLFQYGPIPAGFKVFADFMVGSTGDYANNPWEATGGIYCHLDADVETGKTPAGDDFPYKYSDVVGMCSEMGGHAVVIVGWGEAEVPNFLPKAMPGKDKITIPYWVVRNSWGDKWCNGGYFKIAISNPSLYLNSNVMLDTPKEGFGGAVTFKPDLETLPDDHFDDGGESGSKSSNKTWVWIILIILVAAAVIYFYKKHY